LVKDWKKLNLYRRKALAMMSPQLVIESRRAKQSHYVTTLTPPKRKGIKNPAEIISRILIMNKQLPCLSLFFAPEFT
jgi:hypothetical protein